jgi:hypothetical protein
MGNNLRTVASGDFSNFQLVNSVGGMIKQIGNDSYIRAAVSATANDKKQLAMMDEDRKAGKLAPHAEYYYSLKRQKYYGNTNLKGTDGKPIDYTGKYIQSWDIDKNLLEAIKGVGDSKYSYDQVFEINPVTGGIAKNPDGSPKYSSYATRLIKEGKFSTNVSAAIDGVLNRPEARQELTMRGVYNYRGYKDIPSLMKEYNREANNNISLMKNQIESLQSEYTGLYGDKDPASASRRDEIQKKITELESGISAVQEKSEMNTSSAMEFGDVEALKGTLETMKVRNNYMTQGVTEKIQKQIIENIPYNKAQEKIKADRDWFIAQEGNRRGWAEFSLKKELQPFEMRLKAAQARKAEAEAKEKEGLGPGILPIESLYSENDDRTIVFDTANRFQQDNENFNKAKFGFIADYQQAISGGKKTREQILAELRSGREKDPTNFLNGKYNEALTAVNKYSKNPIFARLRAQTQTLDVLGGKVMANERTQNLDNEEAKRLDKGIDVDILNKLQKGVGTYNIRYKPSVMGPAVDKQVTPEDIMNIHLGIRNSAGHAFGFFATDDENARYEQAEQKIRDKFGVSPTKLNQILSMNRYRTDLPTNRQQPYFRVSDVNSQYLNNARTISATLDSDKYARTVKAKADAIRSRVVKNKDYIIDPYAGLAAKDVTPVKSTLETLIANHSQFPGVDGQDMEKLINQNKGKLVVKSMGGYYDDNPKYSLGFSDGNEFKELFELTPGEAQAAYQGRQLPQTGQASLVSRTVKESRGLTTNQSSRDIYNPNNYHGAMFKGSTFTKTLGNSNIKGADAWQDSTGAGYNAVFYVNSSEGVIPVFYTNPGEPYPMNFPNEDAAADFIRAVKESKGHLQEVLRQGTSQK